MSALALQNWVAQHAYIGPELYNARIYTKD